MRSLDGEGLVRRRVRLPKAEESWLRFVLEAEDGLAVMTAEGDGVVSIYAPEAQARALDSLLRELRRELPFEPL